MKKIALSILLICFGITTKSQTWYQIETNTNKKLNTINFPSSSVGYIGGNDSILLKSIDGGETWNEVNYTGVNFFPNASNIVNLQFVTETVGFMSVGPYSGSYKTIDGGITWTPIPLSLNMCYNQGMYFTDENNGFIGGGACFANELIDKFTDGVLSSASVPQTNISGYTVVDIDFYDASFGLAASNSGYILRTIDGGSNWDTIRADQNKLTSVLIVSDSVCFAGYDANGGGFGILTSLDGGLSWFQNEGSATFFYPAFFGLHQSVIGNIYMGAKAFNSDIGLIFRNTSDVGIWEYDLLDQGINDLDSYGDDVVLGAGDSGYLVVNTLFPIVETLQGFKNEDDIFIYPNPATDVIKIKTLGSKKVQSIKVYSADGRMVASSAENNSSVNISSLKSGLFVLKFLVDGSEIARKFYKE